MTIKLPIPFDNPATYPGHSGVDFAQPRGTPFCASGPGVIGRRNSTARGGNIVWVDYDGYPGVAHAHLDDYTDSPAVGTRVYEGDVIGRVGNSGFSTGPHLHVEVYGHATTAGFWRFFDRNRVVGAGVPSGGSTPLPIPSPLNTEGGIGMPVLFNGVSNPAQYYIAEYDGRTLKCRPTLGVEAKLLLGARPTIPRGQLTDAEVVELCRQGGYEFKNGKPVYTN